jgi:hypothetical protein
MSGPIKARFCRKKALEKKIPASTGNKLNIKKAADSGL